MVLSTRLSTDLEQENIYSLQGLRCLILPVNAFAQSWYTLSEHMEEMYKVIPIYVYICMIYHFYYFNDRCTYCRYPDDI